MTSYSKESLQMAIKARILAKIEPKIFIEQRKRAKSQPELKRFFDSEDLTPERKRLKSMEIRSTKAVHGPHPNSKPKEEVQSKVQLQPIDDDNNEEDYFQLIEETTDCKKISMKERGDAIVIFFKPGQNPIIMKFDNHALPDELCVTI